MTMVGDLGELDGWLTVDVSVDCINLTSVRGGVRLHARERLTILVPRRFPLDHPLVWTRHRRWAGTPHVQWGRQLCLYVAPSVEWDPSDGMFGYVERLMRWLEKAAGGELDAVGMPLHPPVAYYNAGAGAVVVRADAPRATTAAPWFGAALLHHVDNQRVDIVGWIALTEQWPATMAEARAVAREPDAGARILLAPAILLPTAIGFEYPAAAAELLNALAGCGIDSEFAIAFLGLVASRNRILDDAEPNDRDAPVRGPLYLVVGTPGRGVVGQEAVTHLAVWRLPPWAEQAAHVVPMRRARASELARMGRDMLDVLQEWLQTTRTEWTRVYEARAEVVTPRDRGTPASWLIDKRVLVLGAGALGAPIAEACVRGGARSVAVADRSDVHPGILVRQPYVDADIGKPKAKVLAERLGRIRPGAQVTPLCVDVVDSLFAPGQPPPDVDLVIDATGDRRVRTAVELQRTPQRADWPPLATVLIGHDATRGIAALARPGSSGAGHDILRRLSLSLRGDGSSGANGFVDDFFPDPPRNEMFQPEPGCSDVTFIGSAADVVGLSGQLLAAVLHALTGAHLENTMLALLVSMPASPNKLQGTTKRWFAWPDDVVIRAADDVAEVRIAPTAIAEMRAEARRGARVRENRVETGGSILGSFDAAVRVVWVDAATGPPPDSLLSEIHFEHGVEGVEALLDAHRRATGRVSTFVGMWHTHPFGQAAPSPTDEDGMRDLVLPVDKAPPRALLLIAGGPSGRWAHWLDIGGDPDWYARVVQRGESTRRSAPARRRPKPPRDVRWWPGGSRGEPVALAPSSRRWRRRIHQPSR
jgi:integrative and conjugative element protein (TIGR02256 family)